MAFQQTEEMVGHLVVDHAFAGDGAFFQAVERGCIVLVVHDDDLGIVGCIDLLRFAFVNLLQLFHDGSVSFDIDIVFLNE